MKAVPSWLPAANSRKWHNRRWWDALGYYRVRTLDNPQAPRDLRHIERYLTNARSNVNADLVDEAIIVVRRYENLHRQSTDSDEVWMDRSERAWDDVLSAIDDVLAQAQAEHLLAVDEAGCSGRPGSPEDGPD